MNVQIMSEALKRLNKTQKEMAHDVGMRDSRISDMKVDRLKGWKYRRRLSRYLGVDEEILFPHS